MYVCLRLTTSEVMSVVDWVVILSGGVRRNNILLDSRGCNDGLAERR